MATTAYRRVPRNQSILSQTTMCMRISSKNNIVRGLNRSISRRPPSPQAKGFGLRVSTGTQGSAILLRKQVSKGVHRQDCRLQSLPPFTALSRQGGYAHILKGYFYTNLCGTLGWAVSIMRSQFSREPRPRSPQPRDRFAAEPSPHGDPSKPGAER